MGLDSPGLNRYVTINRDQWVEHWYLCILRRLLCVLHSTSVQYFFIEFYHQNYSLTKSCKNVSGPVVSRQEKEDFYWIGCTFGICSRSRKRVGIQRQVRGA